MQGFPDDPAGDSVLWMKGDHVAIEAVERKGEVMKRAALLAVFGLLAWIVSPALAQVEDTRCNGGVIQLGDSIVDVFTKCGEPTRKMGQGGFITLYYGKRDGQEAKIFHIENEKVDSMEEPGTDF